MLQYNTKYKIWSAQNYINEIGKEFRRLLPVNDPEFEVLLAKYLEERSTGGCSNRAIRESINMNPEHVEDILNAVFFECHSECPKRYLKLKDMVNRYLMGHIMTHNEWYGLHRTHLCTMIEAWLNHGRRLGKYIDVVEDLDPIIDLYLGEVEGKAYVTYAKECAKEGALFMLDDVILRHNPNAVITMSKMVVAMRALIRTLVEESGRTVLDSLYCNDAHDGEVYVLPSNTRSYGRIDFDFISEGGMSNRDDNFTLRDAFGDSWIDEASSVRLEEERRDIRKIVDKITSDHILGHGDSSTELPDGKRSDLVESCLRVIQDTVGLFDHCSAEDVYTEAEEGRVTSVRRFLTKMKPAPEELKSYRLANRALRALDKVVKFEVGK